MDKFSEKISVRNKSDQCGDCTSAQLVLKSLTHSEPDRVPLDIGGTRVSGVHVQAYEKYRRALGLPDKDPRMQIRYLQLPRVDEDFRALIDVDVESVDPDTSAEDDRIQLEEDGQRYLDRWGCEWRMPPGGAYFDIVRFPLAHAETVEDLKSFPWPDESSESLFRSMTQEAAEVWNVHKRAVVLGRTCPGIFEMLGILCGHEKAMIDLALNTELSEAIMDKVLECKLVYYKQAVERLGKAGVEYFIISESDDLGGQNGLLISRSMYRRLIKPRHETLFKAIKEFSKGAAFIELHCCGAIREIIPDLIESGVEILNPVQVSAAGMDDTASLKEEFGSSLVFHGGGVDTQGTLAQGSPQDVRDEVCRRMDDLSPGGGFIFTPVHSIQHDVPYENFQAMIDAYKEYGH